MRLFGDGVRTLDDGEVHLGVVRPNGFQQGVNRADRLGPGEYPGHQAPQ